MSRRAFTLMELLVVVAIIALLVALITPVVFHVLERSRQSACISNLRQIGIAIKSYQEDYGGVYPENLARTQPYVKSAELYLCPSDPTRGKGVIGEGLDTSYLSILRFLHAAMTDRERTPDVVSARVLMATDPNYGLVVCQSHGTRETPGEDTLISYGSHSGLILRLRNDASVARVRVQVVCTQEGGTLSGGVPTWHLYSDVRPCPPEVPQDALFLNCPINTVPCP
ncbi:MAG: prepilin-type N-terminal cleavage/methylation domain-containing protein [Fimbriimonadales bacterium]|nr:MAG: hypothetical protein KatS3mg018_0154 [Fimbriimonadales bacterium]